MLGPAPVQLSVVVPVYASEATLPLLYARLRDVLEGLCRPWEIVLVDDASPDQSYAAMCELRRHDSRVRTVRLERNHGQQYATLCGVRHARGGYVVTMDDDLQHSPEDLPKLIAALSAGAQVAIGRVAKGRKMHAWWRNIASTLYQRLLEWLLRKPPGLYLSSFRALAREAVDAIAAYEGAHPHIAALVLNCVPAHAIVNVDVSHSRRADGRSTTYSLSKLFATAWSALRHSELLRSPRSPETDPVAARRSEH